MGVRPAAWRLQTASLYVSNDNGVFTGTGGPQGFSPFTGEFGGVVSSAGLDAEPFQDSAAGLDAGDEIIFVISAENRGGTAQNGLMLRDAIPAGLVQPDGGPDVWVTDGTGAALPFSGNLFDPAGGLLLGGAVPAYDPDSGLNVVLVAFTLFVADSALVPVGLRSTATIVGTSLIASTDVALATPEISFVAEADGALALNQVAAFDLTITFPEGAYRDLRIDPVLPPGLQLVSATATHVGAQLRSQSPIVAGADGSFHLGDFQDVPDNTLDGEDQLLIQFIARARGTVPHQPITATLSWSGPERMAVSAGADVLVLAPAFRLDVTGPASLAPGEVGQFAAVVTNVGNAAAYAVTVLPGLPSGLDLVGMTGPAGADLAAGGAAHVTFSARLNGAAQTSTPLLLTPSASATTAMAGTGSVVYASAQAAVRAVPPANTLPALSGASTQTAIGEGIPVQPFAAASLTDPNEGGSQMQSLTVQLSDPAHGRLTGLGSGTYDAAAGLFSLSGTPAAITTALRGLRFTPGVHLGPAGSTIETQLTVSVVDSAGGQAQATARVAAHTANAPPVLTGSWANQETTTRIAVSPFAGLVLSDPDPNQTSVLTIRMQDAALGGFSVLGAGSYDAAAGTYRATGSLPDLQAMARALVYRPALSVSPYITRFTVTIDDQAGGIASDAQTSIRVAPSSDTFGIAEHFAPSPSATFLTASNGGQTLARGEVYGGPVDYLRSQFIYDGDQSVVIVTTAPDVFIKSFSGYDAIQLHSGQNVVDAGPGSNFLIGGTGHDTFFLDGSSGAVTWDTILGFHPGDMVAMFGFHPDVSSYVWQDDDGTAGFTGRTIHADLRGSGMVSASLTFAGATAADTAQYVVGLGRVGTIDYLSVQYPA